MDIKDKLTQQDKEQLSSLNLEGQVLNNLLNERKARIVELAKQILVKVGCSPDLYILKFNPQQDTWEAVLKEGALIIPNQETRRKIQKN